MTYLCFLIEMMMSNFDSRAREWDKDKMHKERSLAIAVDLENMITIESSMKVLEYGAGTGILSFLLKDRFSEITLMDSSLEMIEVCKEKVEYYKANHIRPLYFDLERNDYSGKFDIIYNQMVMHHVVDVEMVLDKFYHLLRSGGQIAIADLYTEDGSFHGPEVNVHWGFDPEELVRKLEKIGFHSLKFKTCFNVKRDNGREYPVFLLVGQK